MYHRASPTVGTAGDLGRLGIIQARSVGFRSILNLASSRVATGQNDKAMADYARLRYFEVPSAPLPSRLTQKRKNSIAASPPKAAPPSCSRRRTVLR